ncbi:MAG: hypothetical protein OXF02_01280 [Simkaniaceae bacterium]|nr:hypothetical protein [Simkaniaceae bacterium]
MSCFGCFKSSRNGSPTRSVEEEGTRCPFPEEKVSERISDLVEDSLGPGEQIVSVAVPSEGCTTVLYQQSDRSLQQDASKLSAKIVTLSPSQGGEVESEPVEEFGRLLAGSRREESVAEGLTTTHLKTSDVERGADAPATGRSSVSHPPAVPIIEEGGNNQAEEKEKVLPSMVASLGASESSLVVRLSRECECVPDGIVRDEDPTDEVIGKGEDDRIDVLIVGTLGAIMSRPLGPWPDSLSERGYIEVAEDTR